MKRIYEDGYSLNENEYLLKIRKGSSYSYKVNDILIVPHTGFLTKLTKKGLLPKSFDSWNQFYRSNEKLPIYIVEEDFKSGWQILNFRIGESQQWVVLLHPDNYTIEIYLSNYLEISKNITIINGELIGEFKYSDIN